jgi:chromosome partitioning protein
MSNGGRAGALPNHRREPMPDERLEALRAHIRAGLAEGPRIIAVSQRKGGSGKTTCVRTLAEFCSMPSLLGLRTLVIDFDPQLSLSKLYLSIDTPKDGPSRPPLHPEFDPDTDGKTGEWDGRSSSADIFYEQGGVAPYPVTRLTDVGHLHILPGDAAKLVEVEEHDRTYLAERVQERLRQWLALPDVRGDYDVFIIDTAPSDHPLTRAALRAATHLLVPITMEQQGIDGLYEMLSMWRAENRRRTENDVLEIIALQPNLLSQGALHRAFHEQLQKNRAFNSFLSPMVIKRRQAIAERDVRGLKPGSIFQMPPSDETRKMMISFAHFAIEKAFRKRGERNAG